MAALVGSRPNPILRACYQRLLSKGKARKKALVAYMRKLLVILLCLKTITLGNYPNKNFPFALTIVSEGKGKFSSPDLGARATVYTPPAILIGLGVPGAALLDLGHGHSCYVYATVSGSRRGYIR
jgi:hypothetical protein